MDQRHQRLRRWARHGKRPPAAPRFAIASFGPGNGAQIARNVGQSTSGGACPRWGYHMPFDVATLDSLYRSHGDYLSQVVRVTKHNLKNGYILKPDAVRTIEEAMATEVGRGARQRFDFGRDHDFDRDD